MLYVGNLQFVYMMICFYKYTHVLGVFGCWGNDEKIKTRNNHNNIIYYYYYRYLLWLMSRVCVDFVLCQRENIELPVVKKSSYNVNELPYYIFSHIIKLQK